MPAKNDYTVYQVHRSDPFADKPRSYKGMGQKVRPVMFRDVECAPFPVNRTDRLAIMGG